MKIQPQRPQKAIMKFKNDDFVVSLIKTLIETGKVKVTGLGIFEIRHLKPRKSYNPWTKEDIIIPARKKIGFKPEKKFKDAIK